MLQLLSLFDLKRVSSLVIDQIGAMKTFRNIHALSIFLILGSSTLVKAQDSISVGGDFGKDIKPILQQYCYDCHGLKKTKGKVDLTDYDSWSDLEKNPELIEKLIDVLDVEFSDPFSEFWVNDEWKGSWDSKFGFDRPRTAPAYG